jgi:hypothetical protein
MFGRWCLKSEFMYPNIFLRNEALVMWQQEVAVAVAVASRVAVAIADTMEIAMGLLFVASLACTSMVVQPL